MPRGDGTGPMGMGRMTGRGAGYCAGLATPGYANPVGFAGGFGYGRGFRRMFYATGLPGWTRFGYPANAGVYPASVGVYEPTVSEKEILSNQAEFLENQLQQVKKRLSSLREDAE